VVVVDGQRDVVGGGRRTRLRTIHIYDLGARTNAD
jgi:hypothetical protein